MPSRPHIRVVDYGAGNMVSITQALEAAGADVRVARRAPDLRHADGIVVPGVGASGPAMERLRRHGIDDAIRERVDAGASFLGVCLGMQLLFDRSEEDGAEGLGLIPGVVRSIPRAPRLPHIGWNQVDQVGGASTHPLLHDVSDGAAFYFVHSFAGEPADRDAVLARTEHGSRFASVVGSGRLMGVQFHPERSGAAGLQLLSNFVGLAGAA
jgi:glutamine amidotransferase